MSIMGRVYMAYAMRRVFRSQTIRAALSVGSLVSILSFVSVLNVFKNMPSPTRPGELYNFSLSALSSTELGVQIAFFVFLAAILWYARDIIRAFVSSGSRQVA